VPSDNYSQDESFYNSKKLGHSSRPNRKKKPSEINEDIDSNSHSTTFKKSNRAFTSIAQKSGDKNSTSKRKEKP
jgi:hypothetical protein